MPSFLEGLSRMPGLSQLAMPDQFSIALAAGLAIFVVSVRRLRSAPWLIGAVMVVVLALVAVWSLQFDLVGWHGFMHGAPMMRLVDGGPIPPEDPLFAGGTLRYPWFEHWMMASLARATGINPSLETIAFEILLFAAFLGGGAWLASTVTEDREVIGLSVLVAGFGISLFHGGLLRDLSFRLFPLQIIETRNIPIDKFGNISGMPPGYVAMVSAAAASLALLREKITERAAALILAGSTLVAALFHPLSWTGMLAFEGVVILVLLAGRRQEDLRRALWIGMPIAIASLVALPYLRSIGASESSDGWTGVVTTSGLFLSKLWDLELMFGPFVVLAFVYRKTLARMLEAGNIALRILLVAIVLLALAFLVVRFPGRNEYKFLLYLMPGAAVVAAICLRELLSRHVLAGAVVIAVMLLPGGRALGLRPWVTVVEPSTTEGVYLRAINPSSDELFHWIAYETPPDAVFVAADLRIPALGRRPLYIAADAPWWGLDGWGLTRENLLQWHVRRPDDVMHRRQQLAKIMMDANWSPEAAAWVVGEIRKDIPGRPLFVFVQNTGSAERLEKTAGFKLRFRSEAGFVYAVTG